MTLYELSERYQLLLELAEDPDADPEAIADTMEALEGEIESKAEDYGKVIEMLEADKSTIENEIKRLSDKRFAIDKNIGRIKKGLQAAMEDVGKRDIRTPLFHFWIQKNPPAFKAKDEAKIPREFWKPQADKLDTEAAKEYVKIHGEQEWGRLEQKEGLRVK